MMDSGTLIHTTLHTVRFEWMSFSAGLVGDDIFNWEVIIIGPPETLYEGRSLHVFILISIYQRRLLQSPIKLPEGISDETSKNEIYVENLAPQCSR